MERRASASHHIGAFDAKTRFGDLLDRVQRGEVVVITRRGQPVARLVPYSEAIDRDRVHAAVERLLTFGDAEGLRLPKGVKLKDLVDEGRS